MFSRISLPKTTIVVGCLHILGCLYNIIDAIYGLSTLHDDDQFYNNKYENYIQELSFSSLFGLVGVLLIHGTCKKSHLMLLPWLILTGFCLIVVFFSFTMNLLTTNLNWSLIAFGEMAYNMLCLSVIGLCAYIWFAIFEFYQILRDEKKKQTLKADEEKFVGDSVPENVQEKKPYIPTYFIPIAYDDIKQPPSLIKY